MTARLDTNVEEASQNIRQARRRRALMLVPLGVFLILALAFGFGLTRDPSTVPSVLVGSPVPTFSLPPVQGRALGLSSDDLKGEVALVNIFASWCTACRVEHPLFMRLKAEDVVPIHGINYKDAPADAAAWLDELGDPYMRTGTDRDGRVGIDWGVYGVPETFIVDAQGIIRFKQIGPVTPEAWEQTMWPLIQELRQ